MSNRSGGQVVRRFSAKELYASSILAQTSNKKKKNPNIGIFLFVRTYGHPVGDSAESQITKYFCSHKLQKYKVFATPARLSCDMPAPRTNVRR